MRANNNIRKLTLSAMFVALAYLVMCVVHIRIVPSASFLSYDPKDVILAICGFTLGPVAALISAAVVALLEMVTVSDTGLIGFTMNLLSTLAFILPPAICYRKTRTLPSALVGLGMGIALAVVSMLLWNYFITPLYMGIPRESVAAMLPTVFLPFNLIKAALNAAVTLLVYKPVSRALKAAHLLGADAHTPA